MATINYFQSINEFLDKGNRLLILHEQNNSNKNTEEFFLMLNRNAIANEVSHIFENISLSSHKNVQNLSKASQLYIGDRSDKFLFIYITAMDYQNDKKNAILKDVDYISNNFRDVLITAHPILSKIAEQELDPNYTSKNVYENYNDDSPSVTTIAEQGINNMKSDAQEMLDATKKILDEKGKEVSEKIQQKIVDLQPQIDEKISQTKTKLLQISTSLKDGFVKNQKIFSKLTKK